MIIAEIKAKKNVKKKQQSKKEINIFRKLLTLLVVALSMLVACAPTIKTTALVPAKFHEAAVLKEVAVLPFDGPKGSEFTTELEAILADTNINGRQYFTLVERVRIDKLISEMNLSQGGLVDSVTAINLGRLIGAKGIYTGITESTVSNNNWTEERTRYEEVKKFFRTYLQKKKYTVKCTKRVAVFKFAIKLIETETGRVVYANKFTGKADSSACEDSEVSLVSGPQLEEKAKQSAKLQFKNNIRKDIAPYYMDVEIELMDLMDGIKSREAENKFEQGLSYARNNRLDRACELWGETRTISPESPSVLYNLGVCSEVAGNFEQALELYKKADIAHGKPYDKITFAIHRTAEAMQKQKRLKEQVIK